MDRAEARRRRRRKGHIRLAVAIALLVALVVGIGLLVRACACGGGSPEQASTTPPAEGQAAAPTAEATQSPKPVASLPPLVGIGDTVRFQTPQGAVVRVTASDFADPGDAPAGVAARPGERLVTLTLSVTPEGTEGSAPVRLPFKTAESFLLISEDESGAVALLKGRGLLGAAVPPGQTVKTTLAFSVGAPKPVRFVCTPVSGSQPRSATWELAR